MPDKENPSSRAARPEKKHGRNWRKAALALGGSALAQMSRARRREAIRAAMTSFERVNYDVKQILKLSAETDDMLPHVDDTHQDIDEHEADETRNRVAGKRAALEAHSRAFTDLVHVDDLRRIFSVSHGVAQEEMNAYRYVRARHQEPSPYGLKYEPFIVALHVDEHNQHIVLEKFSLEPVFMDSSDAYGVFDYTSRERLEAIVAADLSLTLDTRDAIREQAFGNSERPQL